MGDVEMWELVAPMIYLSRRVDPSSAGIGRHRGGSGQTSLIMFWNTPDYEAEHISAGKMFPTSGVFGGYPAATGYVHDIVDTDLIERAGRGEAYPVEERDRGNSVLDQLGGTHTREQRTYTLLTPFKQGDLYLSTLKGGPGLGDPLLRPVDQIEADIADDHLLARFAQSAYAVDDRDAARARRLERSGPTSEWWAQERERVLAGDLGDPVQVMLAESMRLSPEWAAEFRGFWDLPADFEFDVVCPTVPAVRSEPGVITPAESVAAFLARSRAHPAVRFDDLDPSAPVVPSETLADLVDEKLSRRAVRELQSGHKDPARFDTWVALLQERVGWTDLIVLPLGERLYIVKRRNDGEYVIRTHAGVDLCGAEENWKMHAQIFVRNTDATMQEIYPPLGYPDPAWQELREFYCPASGDLLEVDATPPGYPVVHDFLPDLVSFYEGWLGRPLP
jgi:acetone carboxylase gamma subunit